jgi:hypothetical protein
MGKLKIGFAGRKNKFEQLKAVLQAKEAELARLQRIQQALREKEQVRRLLPIVNEFWYT